MAKTHRRVTELSGTVETVPLWSQRAVTVPAFGSTACTLPISPVLFLRTWPGGNGVERFSTGGFGRAAPGAAGFGLGAIRSFSGSCLGASSSGTTCAPVPFVPVSRTHFLATQIESSYPFATRLRNGTRRLRKSFFGNAPAGSLWA